MADVTELCDNFEGKRLFIIGNGPSLNDTPLERLNDEYTMGINKVHRVYPDTAWRPDIYLLMWDPWYKKSERYVGDDPYDFVRKNIKTDIPCFLRSEFGNIDRGFLDRPNVHFFDRFKLRYDTIPLHSMSPDDVLDLDIDHLQEYWSQKIEYHIYEYHSMYTASQIAAYLGFDEIIFVGCDLGFEYKDPHMIYDGGLDPFIHSGGKKRYIRDAIKQGSLKGSLVNALMYKLISNDRTKGAMERVIKVTDPNRVDPNYMNGIQIIDERPLNTEMRRSHAVIKRVCNDLGIDVYNATIGGELEIYERIDLEDVL